VSFDVMAREGADWFFEMRVNGGEFAAGPYVRWQKGSLDCQSRLRWILPQGASRRLPDGSKLACRWWMRRRFNQGRIHAPVVPFGSQMPALDSVGAITSPAVAPSSNGG
jgi:hypothetical protein